MLQGKNTLSELNQARNDVKYGCALEGSFFKSVTVNLMFLHLFLVYVLRGMSVFRPAAFSR